MHHGAAEVFLAPHLAACQHLQQGHAGDGLQALDRQPLRSRLARRGVIVLEVREHVAPLTAGQRPFARGGGVRYRGVVFSESLVGLAGGEGPVSGDERVVVGSGRQSDRSDERHEQRHGKRGHADTRYCVHGT